ncbi:Phosphatidylcholine:ceramide cholinephosphotransferase 1 [Caenorhabditis elegans]|uniref:Isoform a of Phosphatidylcholine:ceramide cholinephosphotransferase 1 n=1 Tax=Caenorhabditis elegans TaxID=6239 RepID=Q9U3D4-2|nr:Phosphatidylcholine:ceramide cholinephosphotransferase 1 [Caenorhabditis elegans]CAB09114.2 Phosphatidylcholine:ceramide cholinephosphotransferase 1 [Caenorhabditis elegans]|eukprot:NP_502169.2 Phosphatidylcholine:ceramide cholinephosphotransferase 1 [Caenorhabditis elegans]
MKMSWNHQYTNYGSIADDNGDEEKAENSEGAAAEKVEKQHDDDGVVVHEETDGVASSRSSHHDKQKPGETKKSGDGKMDDDDIITTARSSSRRICGSAASSSDSETADDAPLLPDEGPSHAVRLEMPGDKPASPHDRFPKTPLKTLVAFLMLVVAAAGNTITLSWIHERYPLTPPLPDIVFELIPKIPWGLRLCENLMIGSFVSLLVLILFHRHRWIVLRRLCFIGSILYGMRCITMMVTPVPKADEDFECSPRFGENATFSLIVMRGVWSMFGLGLNLFDNQKVVLCGDYIYSGHTLVLVVSALFIGEYSPRRFYILHWLSWLVCSVGVIFLVLSHGHYTIDVILSYFACTRVFWAYHTQAAHPSIRLSVQNHQAKEFWFPLLRWFEGDIRRPVPRRFDCPISYSQVCNAFRRVRPRGRNGAARPAFE